MTVEAAMLEEIRDAIAEHPGTMGISSEELETLQAEIARRCADVSRRLTVLPDRRETWYKLTEFLDDDHHLMDSAVTVTNADGEEQQIKRPVYAVARFYDRDRERILSVVRVDMDALPYAAIQTFKRLAEANEMSPVLMVPPGVEFMRLKPVSNTEAERAKKRCQKDSSG